MSARVTRRIQQRFTAGRYAWRIWLFLTGVAAGAVLAVAYHERREARSHEFATEGAKRAANSAGDVAPARATRRGEHSPPRILAEPPRPTPSKPRAVPGSARVVRGSPDLAPSENAPQKTFAEPTPPATSNSAPANQIGTLMTARIQQKQTAQHQGLNPRNDGWDTEAFVEDAKVQLKRILRHVCAGPTSQTECVAAQTASPDIATSTLYPKRLQVILRDPAVQVRRADATELAVATAEYHGQEGFARALEELRKNLPGRADNLETELHIYGLHVAGHDAATKVQIQFRSIPSVRAAPRVLSVAADTPAAASNPPVHQTSQGIQVTCIWDCLWKRRSNGLPLLSTIRVRDYEEATSPPEQTTWFADCTLSVLNDNPSFHQQLAYGLDHWLKRVERAHRMHVFAASGLAVGDVNGDSLDDLYVCQPGGLPNRLFVQNVDGTATDRSALAGVDWLDSTSSALLVDLDNDGDQDLVLATLSGALVLSNDSTGRFKLEGVLPTDGADTQSLCAADYDNDGDVDVYLCMNFPKVTAEAPKQGNQFVYHDAQDGAPNRLFRNDIRPGQPWSFSDVTVASGLDADNRRHSLAAAWEDYDNDGDQDLYVANDYGPNCLYRNDGGHFVNVAHQSGTVDYGSGMSVSWADFNRDGRMDLYVGNMFSSAGSRITSQDQFRPGVDPRTRNTLRRFAKGNSLFLNRGEGSFQEVSAAARVEMARWAWSSLFVDLDNSGWEDIFVANGYITTEDTGDL